MHKIHILFFAFIILFFSSNSWAQERVDWKWVSNRILLESAKEIQQESPKTLEESTSLLWKISKKGMKKPSYLFGTMHSGDEEVMAIGETTIEWLKKCDVVALELDMDHINFMEMMGFMMMKDTVLTDLISKEDYKLIQERVKKKLGVAGSFLQVKRIKPLFLSSLIGDGEQESFDLSGGQAVFLDMWLQKQGKKYGKEIIGIETMSEQLQAIDKIPLVYQAQMLVDALKNEKNEAKNSAAALLEVYISKDLNAIYEFYQKENAPTSNYAVSFEKAIITHRNYIMAERMDGLMQKKQTIFNAVGALHLPGNEGVIELLRQRGYRLTPITLE